VGEWGVDLQRLGGDLYLLFAGHRVERLHIVQAVGEFDDHHAQVFGDRHQQFAQVVGGLGDAHAASARLVENLHLALGVVQFGDAFHQLAHGRPEALLQLFGLGGGVFQHIVQQSRDDGVDPHLQVCQDVRDGERVRDVRLPAPARLSVVAFFGEQVRLHQARGIGVGRVVPNLLDERFDLFWEFVIQRLHPTSRASHRCRAHRR